MKNSKKILIALSSIALLVATVFSVISAAVKAGEGTSIEEYTKMKITVSHGFENGTTTSDDGWKLFGSIVNRDASLVGEKSQGGLVTINNTRRAPLSAYGNDTESLYY